MVIKWLLLAVVILGARTRLTSAAEATPPPCDMVAVQRCIDAASQSANATGCNWYVLVPPLQACLNTAAAGCMYDQQMMYQTFALQYNQTLQSDSCNPACQNQTGKANTMFQCFAAVDFGTLPMAIIQNPVPSNPSCAALNTMNSCLVAATANCPALQSVAHDTIANTTNGQKAYSACGTSAFPGPTTNAPVALLVTQPTTTTTTGAVIVETDKSLLIFVIIGSIIIAATVLIIIAVIWVSISRRREIHRRSILGGWRPNGQRVYMDSPPQLANQGRKDFSGFRPAQLNYQDGVDNYAMVQ